MTAEKKDFLSRVGKNFGPLSLKEVSVDPELRSIEVEGGRIDLAMYKTEKIEKLTFSTIKIFASSVSEVSVLVWPEDNYDLPLFWCNLTQMPGMNIFINDFVPLTDIIVWPQYGEKYLNDLFALKNSAAGQLKEGLVDRAFTLATKTAWALSPHCTAFSLKDEAVGQLDPIIDQYCSLYVRLWQKAALIETEEERAFTRRKKEAVRKLMKGNDPGYFFMIKTFGEDMTGKVFDLIF